MRWLRYLYRVPMLLWHALVDLPLVLLLMLPPWGRLRLPGGEPLDYRMIRAWQAGLMRVFGFRMRRSGTPLAGAVVFVANHVSWVDIVALHSQRMMGFVAKREIRGWPVVGWLASRGETIYHQRGDQASLGGVLHEMLARLRALGIPAGLSQSAGAYVCNQAFYVLGHLVATRYPGLRAGFVHVPWLPEQAARHHGQPSMALDTMIAGVRAAIECAVATHRDLRVAGGSTH